MTQALQRGGKKGLLTHGRNCLAAHFTCLGCFSLSQIPSSSWLTRIKENCSQLTSLIMVPSLQNSLGMTGSDKEATAGAWTTEVSTVAPLWSSSSFQHFQVLQEAPRTPSSLQPAKSFLYEALSIKAFFLYHHLPSATQPSAAPLCYMSALRDLPPPFTSPALDRKDTSWPQDPIAGCIQKDLHPKPSSMLTCLY